MPSGLESKHNILRMEYRESFVRNTFGQAFPKHVVDL